MGCAYGKQFPPNSPPRRLEEMKRGNGYVAKGGIAPHRRSTGQRNYNDKIYQQRQPSRNRSNGSSTATTDTNTTATTNTTTTTTTTTTRSDGSGKEKNEKREDGGGGGKFDDRRAFEDGMELLDENGWPKWLVNNVPKEALAGLVPKSAEKYDMLDKVGEGTYSNVYKARDRETKKIVAMKKVRFDTSEPESVKFMAREIMMLRKLDHPNVVKLEGLATSRLQYSIYLIFDFMQSDLARIISRPEERLTEPQVKCYMHQLLSGLQHCHDKGILHRDIKASNLLIDRNGMLKIADFGLANYYSPNGRHHLTSRVVTLWYRAPELLLGATNYGVGIDLWSAGCLLAEMFASVPIMPGRTEVEQLHRIFKLCGTPSDDYWKKLKLSTTFRPPRSYRPSLFEAFSAFPESSLGLLSKLLALDPSSRGSASSALQDEYFFSSPRACDLSGLPVIQQDEDEVPEANEQRISRKNSRMKRRSKTQREQRRKDSVAESPKEDPAIYKEEPEKDQLTVQNQELSSGRSSLNEGWPLLAIEPYSRVPLSPRRGHPNGGKNARNQLPPLPTSNKGSARFDNEKVYRLSQVCRSSSTREFRKFNEINS